jgi:hypothetical protein
MENSRGADVRRVIPLAATTEKTAGVEMTAPWATLSVTPVSVLFVYVIVDGGYPPFHTSGPVAVAGTV